MSAELSTVEVDAEPTEGARDRSAPYMSFQGFLNLLDRLHQDGVPQVFDKSFFGQRSGSLVAQTRGTLRFLDLMGEDKRPTPHLVQMASAEDQERIEILRELARSKYGDAIALGTDATYGQLAETFRASGLTGTTLRKAVTFYVGLAEHVGIPISPYFKQGVPRLAVSSSSAPRRPARRRRGTTQPAETAPAPLPPDPPSIESKQFAYIDLLMKLVEANPENGEAQKDLLDRLELALGYKASSETPRE